MLRLLLVAAVISLSLVTTTAKVKCPPRDQRQCSLPPPNGYGNQKKLCKTYYNVEQECPFMCGTCKGEQKPICNGLKCLNGGTLDEDKCICQCLSKFVTGKQCQKVKCPEKDRNGCGIPAPLGMPQSYCKIYFNIKDECPYMCGICKGKQLCNGLSCMRGGKLNKKTCKCECPKLYRTPSCLKLKCPPHDRSVCNKPQPHGFPKSWCQYDNVKDDCPFMCGICKGKQEPFCKGMKCENGGTLDPEKCVCACTIKYFTGKRCEKASCPPHDRYTCNKPQPYGYPKSMCNFDKVREECPFMCGFCKGKQKPFCNGMKCENGGTLDIPNCKCLCPPKFFTGKRCEISNCPPHDKSHCGKPKPYGYLKSECTYDNVKEECPFMCNVCKGKQKAICDGLKCLNGGTLDPHKCVCQCQAYHKGKKCEIVQCPPRDDPLCGQPPPYGFQKSLCIKYTNVQKKCPFMCGICKGKQKLPCNGLTCKNGKLDEKKCICKCPAIYKGNKCETLVCPKRDKNECGLPGPKGYPKEYCKKYANTKDICPFMCGICTGKQVCNGKKCFNLGVLDEKACTCKCRKLYKGDNCEKLTCPDHELKSCGKPKPYGFPKELCKTYLNVQEDCPFMCGICKGPQKFACNGLTCANAGTLDTKACKCKCAKLYTGKSCQTLNCPKQDNPRCGVGRPYGFPTNSCKPFYNVKEECPFMCGICKGKPVVKNLPRKKVQPPCIKKYEATTVCKYKDHAGVKPIGVDKADAKLILDLHNALRRTANPTATNMQKMAYDETIAAFAQKWSNVCFDGHDKSAYRVMPEFKIPMGQNWAHGYNNWTHAIMGWHEEINFYKYGLPPKSYLGKRNWTEIAHYTLLMQDEASTFGCGLAMCPNLGLVHTCNYVFGNKADLAHPYKKGKTCGECPKSCKKKLCDCGGKFCLNDGKLDINNCVCKCQKIYKGAQCERLECPLRDEQHCGQPKPHGYTKEMCKTYGNVKMECPFMCGICKGKQQLICNGLACWNGGKLNKDKCKCECPKPYQGKKCEILKCPKLDNNLCTQPAPGGYPESYCKIYTNIKEECPYMCGICKGKQLCDGLKCFNEGSLNTAKCECKCAKIYNGKSCKNLNCPKADPVDCGRSYPKSYCMYSNIPPMCPYMCGVCKAKGEEEKEEKEEKKEREE